MSRKKTRILVVDDEAAMREVLELRLSEMGFNVILAESGGEAQRLAESQLPDIVISDVVLPDRSGLELLQALKAGDRRRPVILITAYGAVDSAVEAIKLGALDFLTKPLDYEKLASVLAAAGKEIAQRSRVRRLEDQLDHEVGLGSLVGLSKAMRDVYRSLETLGSSDASAILAGESGTGKELAARTIHELSARTRGPFVAVNTAAIPETLTESELFGHTKGAFTGAATTRTGYFEQADGGTLLLDEISEMPVSIQPKLLRVLEDGRVRKIGSRQEVQVDVRVLAATNRTPEEAVRSGKLRQDLFYRLSVFTIELPPLRKRSEDIPLLVQHFVRAFNHRHGTEVDGVGEDALSTLTAYRWPGNVRELRNVIERAAIVAREGWIETLHLPPFLRDGAAGREDISVPVGTTVAEAEKMLIMETLQRMGGNKSRAARALGLDVRTIRYKLRSYEESQ
jgi:DNA-binding NtrC family response regulator